MARCSSPDLFDDRHDAIVSPWQGGLRARPRRSPPMSMIAAPSSPSAAGMNGFDWSKWTPPSETNRG